METGTLTVPVLPFGQTQRLEEANAVLDRLQREPKPPVGVRRSGGVGAECDAVRARLFECHDADGKGSVNDFETAKLRRGVQACLQPDRTQDDSELLQTIQ